MPKRSEWPPRVRPHPQSGQERVWWAGKWHYLGPAGSDQARQEYASLLARVTGGELEPVPRQGKAPRPITVADVLASWLERAAPLLTERGGEEAQFRKTFVPLDRLFADLPAAEFNASRLAELQAAMATGSWLTEKDREAARKEWSRKVVNQRLGRVRKVWRWAEKMGLVPAGSFASLMVVENIPMGSRLAAEGTGRRTATLAEVKAVCRCFPRHAKVLPAMLLVQWWSGCRPGEVRTMRAGEVDTSGPVWLYRPRLHKCDRWGHDRVIPLGPRAQAVLSPWLLRAREKGPDTHVFPPSIRRGRATHYRADSYSHAVTRAADLAGMPPGWACYSTRHGARDRVGRAAGDEAARSFLGHRSVSTTMQYGSRIDHQFAADLSKRLG